MGVNVDGCDFAPEFCSFVCRHVRGVRALCASPTHYSRDATALVMRAELNKVAVVHSSLSAGRK